MSDMTRDLTTLKRNALNASYGMTVDRSMVLKLIAAADLAEADIAHDTAAASLYGHLNDDRSERARVLSETADAHWAAQDAYRKATGR